jgi:hypothetical protein
MSTEGQNKGFMERATFPAVYITPPLSTKSAPPPSVPVIAAITAGIILLGLCLLGLIFYLVLLLRRNRREKLEESGGTSKVVAPEIEERSNDLEKTAVDDTSCKDFESIRKGGRTACDSCSTNRPSMASYATKSKSVTGLSSPLSIAEPLFPPAKSSRPISTLQINTTRLFHSSDEGDVRISEEQQRNDHFNQVLLNSPIVEQVLRKSYDFKGKVDLDNKVFDWKNCDFKDVEEEAMWLPSRPESAARSLSSPRVLASKIVGKNHKKACNSMSTLVSSPMHPSTPNSLLCSSPAYFDLDRSKLSAAQHPSSICSPLLLGSPLTSQYSFIPLPPQTGRSPQIRSMSSEGPIWNHTKVDTKESLRDSFSRKASLVRHSFSTSAELSSITTFRDPFAAEGSTSKAAIDTMSSSGVHITRPASTPLFSTKHCTSSMSILSSVESPHVEVMEGELRKPCKPESLGDWIEVSPKPMEATKRRVEEQPLLMGSASFK